MRTITINIDLDTPHGITLARTVLELTQAELAAVLGASLRSVQNWEGGTSTPRPRYLDALAALIESHSD